MYTSNRKIDCLLQLAEEGYGVSVIDEAGLIRVSILKENVDVATFMDTSYGESSSGIAIRGSAFDLMVKDFQERLEAGTLW